MKLKAKFCLLAAVFTADGLVAQTQNLVKYINNIAAN